MYKRFIPLLVLLFAFAVAGAAFADTEDEIIAKYLKKAEKQRKHRVYFGSVSFAYGKLPTYSDYTMFYHYSNRNINPGSPLTGIWRSKQLAFNMGMMVTRKVSVRLGVEYWLKLGSEAVGDYDFGIAPLGLQEDFDLGQNPILRYAADLIGVSALIFGSVHRSDTVEILLPVGQSGIIENRIGR